MEKERLLAFFLFQIDVQKKKEKKSSISFPPNYQRISNKESLVTAHFRILPSPEPEVRCLRRQIHLSGSLTLPFILNIGQTELSSTSIAPNVDTRYFRQNFPHHPPLDTHTYTYIRATRSFSKRSTRSCSGDFVKQSIKARCRQIYGGSVVAFPARKQLKFMPTAWIIRFRSRDQPPKRRFRLSVCEIRSRKVCESSLLPLRELQI